MSFSTYYIASCIVHMKIADHAFWKLISRLESETLTPFETLMQQAQNINQYNLSNYITQDEFINMISF